MLSWATPANILQTYELASFYIGNEHIIEQIVSNKFSIEMQSSSINNLEQKYALAYTLVNQLMADGKITHEASFGGTLKSANFTSSDFIERTYRTYDNIMSGK